jgi:hypothetical protein
MGNGPHVLMGALAPPPSMIPSLLVALLPLALLLPLIELMRGVVVAPLGATIPLMI